MRGVNSGLVKEKSRKTRQVEAEGDEASQLRQVFLRSQTECGREGESGSPPRAGTIEGRS
jgi:hypothetical protein